jgi:hypothetical protein
MAVDDRLIGVRAVPPAGSAAAALFGITLTVAARSGAWRVEKRP